MTTAKEWIENVRGLDPENLVRHRVRCGESKVMGGREAVAIPYVQGGEVKALKVRAVGSRADLDHPFDWSPRGAKVTLWNVDILGDDTLREHPVIVTEGEFDALAVIECGFPRTVSIPHGAASGPRYIHDHADRLKRSPCVIIAGDDDEDGRGFVRSAAAALDGHEVRYVVWPDGCKDANDTLAKHGAPSVVEAINSAKLVHPEDPAGGMLTGFRDAPPPPAGAVYRTGDSAADLVLCFHTGFLTIMTGTPGSGKSTFLTWALWKAAREHGLRLGVSLMETPWPYLRDHLSRLEKGRPWDDLRSDEQDTLAERLDLTWRLMHRRDEDNVAADLWWIREMMRVAAVRDGCKIVAFDPWNELDHIVPKGQAITDYVNDALAQMRQWAERFDCALCIVAHPTKMNREAGGKVYPPMGWDIAGSAAWVNKAAVGITVHREQSEDGDEVAKIINWKAKFRQLYRIREGAIRMQFDENLMLYRRMKQGGLTC